MVSHGQDPFLRVKAAVLHLARNTDASMIPGGLECIQVQTRQCKYLPALPLHMPTAASMTPTSKYNTKNGG